MAVLLVFVFIFPPLRTNARARADILAPSNGQTFNYYETTNINIKVSISSSYSVYAVLYIDGNRKTSWTSTGTKTYPWNTTGISRKTYQIRLRVFEIRYGDLISMDTDTIYVHIVAVDYRFNDQESAVIENRYFKYWTEGQPNDWTVEIGTVTQSLMSRDDHSDYAAHVENNTGTAQLHQSLSGINVNRVRQKTIEVTYYLRSDDDSGRVGIRYHDELNIYDSWGSWIPAYDSESWTCIRHSCYIPDDALGVTIFLEVDDFNGDRAVDTLVDCVEIVRAKYLTSSLFSFGKMGLAIHISQIDFFNDALDQAVIEISVSAEVDEDVLQGEYNLPYCLMDMELIVEMLPIVVPPWPHQYYTTQIGKLYIVEQGQSNNQDKIINTEDPDNARELGTKAISAGVGLVIGAATSTIETPLVGTIIGAVAGEVTNQILNYWEEQVSGDNWFAEGGTDYYTRINWLAYNSPTLNLSETVTLASATQSLDWKFRPQQPNHRQIRVTATVAWGYWDPDFHAPETWYYPRFYAYESRVAIIDI